MADDFSIEPSYVIQMDEEAQVLQADFGDGYSQRAAPGLNSIKTVWQLVWKGISVTNADTLISLFRGRKGVAHIHWTPKRAATTASKVVGTDTNTYTCILTHISATNNKPITGSAYATYWSNTGSGGSTWASDLEYYSASNEMKWICKKWSRTFESNDFDTVTANFERVFDLS